LTTLRCCCLQVENFDHHGKKLAKQSMLEWHDKSNSKDYFKVEIALVKENYELILKIEYF